MNCPTIILAILNFCLNIVTEERFKLSYVIGNHFVRNRKLGFKDFILCVVFSPKRSLQSMLYHYIQMIQSKLTDIKYSKQAYSKQRQFIRPEAILEFIDASVQMFYSMAPFKTFNGYILTAVDGTKYNLPNSIQLQEKYGEQATPNKPLIQAMGSCLYDVLNGIILHCQLGPCKGDERELARKHVDALSAIPHDKFILTFDRGYPSYDLIKKMEERGLFFIIRASKAFMQGFRSKLNGSDCVVTHAFAKYYQDSVTMRVITVKIPFGETQYLITNMMDKTLTIEDFSNLYQKRWKIETSYNDLKNKITIEDFSGTNDIAILQDYYASIFLANLASVLVFEMENIVQCERRTGNKYEYKQNMNLTIGQLRGNIIQLILADSQSQRKSLLLNIVRRLSNAVVPIRPDRAFCRVRKHKTLKFPQNMKQA